jgi:hypothetical protein
MMFKPPSQAGSKSGSKAESTGQPSPRGSAEAPKSTDPLPLPLEQSAAAPASMAM